MYRQLAHYVAIKLALDQLDDLFVDGIYSCQVVFCYFGSENF